MGLKTVDVPRNLEDRDLVPYLQKMREAMQQAQTVNQEFDVHVALNGDRTFGFLTFSTAAGGVVDSLIYTVPPNASRFGTYVLSRPIVWLFSPVTGAGTVNIRLGTSAGGNDIVSDQPVVAATTLKLIGGLSIASLGTAMLAANGYEAALDPGTPIWARAASTGTVNSGSALVGLYSYWEPL